MTSGAVARGTPQRWLAPTSFGLAGLAIVILVAFAELKSLAPQARLSICSAAAEPTGSGR
jgi:hypothetical protein